jgi:predicted nuclease with TOPRIM domain
MSKFIAKIITTFIVAVAVVGGLYFGVAFVTGRWDNFKQALINEGTTQCVNAERAEETKRLAAEVARLTAEVAKEKETAKRLKDEVSEAKAESGNSHKRIADLMKGNTGTIPDELVDEINKPIKVLKVQMIVTPKDKKP